jgi:hypothetical protein
MWRASHTPRLIAELNAVLALRGVLNPWLPPQRRTAGMQPKGDVSPGAQPRTAGTERPQHPTWASLSDGDKKKTIMVIGATVLLAASSTVAIAGSKGASSFSPGFQIKEHTTPRTGGASEFTPAEMKGTGTKGASDFTPGDTRNDLRKTKK